MEEMFDGFIEGSTKDSQSITSDWESLQERIEGVELREVKNVLSPSAGSLTELFRRDWELDDGTVDQVFQNILEPAQITGWHVHEITTDRIFVNIGNMKIALYDARTESNTYGLVNIFVIGQFRPGLLVIPPGIWHAVQNTGSSSAALINMVDKAYDYENPDHWRLPINTNKIPYSFKTTTK